MLTVSTLATIRRAPHAVDSRSLTAENVQKLLDAGLVKRHRDDPNKVFTVKAQRKLIDIAIEGTTAETPKPLPVELTLQQKLYLKMLRTFSHGVTAIDIAKVRSSLVKLGYIRKDKRDGDDITSARRRYFTVKGKRAEIDSLNLA